MDTLKIGWCKIGDGDGAKALADLLMFNQTLSTVDLRGNILVRLGFVGLSHLHPPASVHCGPARQHLCAVGVWLGCCLACSLLAMFWRSRMPGPVPGASA